MGKEPAKSRRHACPQCDYKTGNLGHLRKHVRTVHEQRRDHACPQCDAAFGEAGNLKTHVRTVHRQREEEIVQVYECELDCGFRSTDFAAVEQHEVSCAEKV